ncbi:DUF4274 domain-containing protein [Rhodobacter sp. SGA-6-6]|uniref:DUF4274 domain-containing protein n=1 Tax=Rhodobacter sp. SGA-6-6 TaxID=2710882 RepID=UPI0013EBC199|nr:DUF4274 domain-containing protein [Rhodobacter sp. SGA-6-6]NGM44217.1 DUF4274 domain-containing protein [Rhodobacter sp. SGA-6-6]
MYETLPLPQGLTAFLLPEGPDMWHEFALGLDFTDPRASIDLLLAADAITSREDCDRATALLILAKARAAGFHCGECPPGFDEDAARAFADRLSAALAAGAFPTARFALPPQAQRLVAGMAGLPRLRLGWVAHRPHHGFAGWRPVTHAPLARLA